MWGFLVPILTLLLNVEVKASAWRTTVLYLCPFCDCSIDCSHWVNFFKWMFSSVLFGCFDSILLFTFRNITLLNFLAISVRNFLQAASSDKFRWEPFACELVRWLPFMSDRWETVLSGYSDKVRWELSARGLVRRTYSDIQFQTFIYSDATIQIFGSSLLVHKGDYQYFYVVDCLLLFLWL